MKLAFLFDTKLEKYEGHYYAVNLGKELWESRYFPYFSEIILVCRCREVNSLPQKKHQADVDGVKVIAFEDKGIINRVFSTTEEKKTIRNVISNCDAVICRGFWGTDECRKLNKPYMIEVVSCLWDSMWNHSLIGKIAALPMFLSMRKAVKKADFVLYVTEKFLQSRYPSNGFCVGVSDVITFPANNFDKECRLRKIRLINDNSKIKVGTTAAVNVPYKGQRFVIGTLKVLKERGIENIEYHMAGGGSIENLKKLAEEYGVSDKVAFHGSLQHDEVQKFLDQIDIYIQPSLQEGLPRAVVEAMSRGLPCIGTNTGGIPELVRSDYICDKRKNLEKEIADKIILMLQNNNMEELSVYSYAVADRFEKGKLDKKRADFMNRFLNQIK